MSDINDSEISNESSDVFELSYDGSLCTNTKEMELEELRLEEKSSKEHNADIKHIRENQTKERKEKALKSMCDLLNLSKKYSNYYCKTFSQECNNNANQTAEGGIENVQQRAKVFKQPKYFSGGTLKPYQNEGLKWLKKLYTTGVNGILADEMGLGKTIQVIALICFLIEKKIPGPFLIVAPLSTLPNWVSEFKRFAPKIPIILFHGSAQERMNKYKDISKTNFTIDEHKTAPVVITSYNVPMVETAFLRKFTWQYIIIDEGHRIKNHECKLVKDLKLLHSLNRLLLTGTPLQNSLIELWSLLNFLLPQFFKNADTFDSLFMLNDFQESDKLLKEKQNIDIISTIHGVLSPFMLRRLKSDVLTDLVPKKEILVYCPMTEFQRDLYKLILENNYEKLVGKEKEPEDEILPESRAKRLCTYKGQIPKDVLDKHNSNAGTAYKFESNIVHKLPIYDLALNQCNQFLLQIRYMNNMMTYKRVVNHPYLIYFPLKSGTNEFLIDEKIIEYSGKMKMLDALLPKLKERGHKVLLFSTLKIMLDIIEDYMILRNYDYCRLDGDRSLDNRQESIKEFNENPDKFIFLISTRAGGLGLNLTAADTVIVYDKDWNPQVDIQAHDRCHRIGQTKPVMIYSFVSKGSLDERILGSSTAKRRLEKIVISKGKFKSLDNYTQNVTNIVELQKLLEAEDHNMVVHSNGKVISDQEIEQLLDRSELYEEMEKRNQKQL